MLCICRRFFWGIKRELQGAFLSHDIFHFILRKDRYMYDKYNFTTSLKVLDIPVSVVVLDCHHIVGLKVRIGDVHKCVEIVLGQIHQVLVNSLDVPGAGVPQRKGSRTDGALVRLGSCVGLPVTSVM